MELAVDENSNPIQTLAMTDEVVSVSTTTTSATNLIPNFTIGEDVVRVASTTDLYIAFGNASITAGTSDTLFLSGTEYLKVPRGATHFAVRAVGTSGICTVTRMD